MVLDELVEQLLEHILKGSFEGLDLVAINATATPEKNLHLFQYDSVHGRFNGSCEVADNNLFNK